MEWTRQVRTELDILYGPQLGGVAAERLFALLGERRIANQPGRRTLSQEDIVLITYGDSLRGVEQKPLAVLKSFADRYLTQCFSAIHLLPFFPFSSDDGFSVIDFLAVNPALGDWNDIQRLTSKFDLMFDFVLNHISAESDWFRRYLSGAPEFGKLAIEVAAGTDLSQVVRPRTLPLLTPFTKANAETVLLWTTFSADQIDLNYRSIEVLLRMLEVLLAYVDRGARLLRLDAVAYLWKEIGTTCIHLPQTHAMIRLLRCVLDQVAPEVLIITETNVPHAENISYFGVGADEAQMVYNFTLPPLVMHALLTADARALSQWAQSMRPPSRQTAFFNFTASHDGIGVRPLEGILPEAEIERLMQATIQNAGQVAFGQDRSGRTIPYELNVTYVDGVQGVNPGDVTMQARRFLASQAIALVLPGVPGIYIHSLLGSRNWLEGVHATGRARSINRQPLSILQIRKALSDPTHFRSMVFGGLCHMLKTRRAQPAFHPNAASTIIDLDRRVFAVRREYGGQVIHALTNISPDTVRLNLPETLVCRDRLTLEIFQGRAVVLRPYQSVWLSEHETEPVIT